MPEIEEEVIGSQTEDDQTHESDADTDASMLEVFKEFGIGIEDKKEAPESDPATEKKPEARTIKVKHNKNEIEVDVSDDKLPEYVQKSLALDKERERKSELERTLDRVAKLAGFNDHAEYVANLDKLEQEQAQAKEREFEALEQSLYDELVENGLNEAKARQYIENHPAMKQARELRAQQQSQMQTQQVQSKWQALYDKYPHLVEDAQAFNKGELPTFFTDDMRSRVERGYDPIDAFELAHKDTLSIQAKKATEQRLIKQQQLGLRSKVETVTTPDNEPVVPDALASAFEAFGLPRSAAKKYV